MKTTRMRMRTHCCRQVVWAHVWLRWVPPYNTSRGAASGIPCERMFWGMTDIAHEKTSWLGFRLGKRGGGYWWSMLVKGNNNEALWERVAAKNKQWQRGHFNTWNLWQRTLYDFNWCKQQLLFVWNCHKIISLQVNWKNYNCDKYFISKGIYNLKYI